MPHRLAAAVLGGLLVLGVTGCEIDPGQAPVDASAKDFCTSWARLAGADVTTSSDDMNDYVKEFAHYGTPRGIPTAARNGFEYVVDPDRDFSSGADFAALQTRGDLIGQDAVALKTYADQIC